MTPSKLLLLLPLALGMAAPVSAQRPGLETELHGLILVNAFANSEDVNNSDVPQFALPPRPPGGLPSSAAGGTVRQSRIQVRATVSEFAGGRLSGNLDVDFFGGQQPSTGGRTFPLLRIRRAFAEFTRGRLGVLVGQEAPPIVEINPSSLASIGIPGFAGAGNLWLWIPQVRVGVDSPRWAGPDSGSKLRHWPRLPATPRPPSSPSRISPSGAADRICRAASGPDGEVERLRGRSTSGDTSAGWPSVPMSGSHPTPGGERMDAARARTRLRGEAYTGQAVAGLGGGGIGQNFGVDSTR